MNDSVETITFLHLLPVFIPVAVVLFILVRWSLEAKSALYALSRMLGQLLLVGYFLAFIFESPRAEVILLILAVMAGVSSWIALRTVSKKRKQLYHYSLFSITVSGAIVLAIVVGAVLQVDPWYLPKITIPLAGMIFSNAMTAVSLAAERFYAEKERGASYIGARNIAFGAALIPITNALFAVGLVSLPGMMTGQILSGVSPLIAARYQIMVMAMVYGCSGMATAIFLMLLKRHEK